MRERIFPILVLLLGVTFLSFGQGKKTAIVKGKIINSTTKADFIDVKVTIPELSVFTRSGGEGQFELSEIPFGTYTLVLSGSSVVTDSIKLLVDKDVVDLKDIPVSFNANGVSASESEIPTISLADNSTSNADESDDGNGNGEDLLIASRDPFVNATNFVFGALYFRPRGQRATNETEVNGVPFNNAQNGLLSWGQQLGDQNDVFRGREVRYGLEPSPYAFGSANGSTYLQATAADQQKENKVSYTSANRLYRDKIMFTKSSGLMKNGWAYSLSFNKKWSKEGYVPGTFFDGYAYYGSLSKVKGLHQFNLTTFGAPSSQGRAYTATQESFDLSGNKYYNSAWGYQTVDGNQVKRSALVSKVFQPVAIFSYEYKPDEKTRWTSALGYQMGKDRASSLDGYNAPNPFGNYYKNLPNYYYTMNPPDSTTGNLVKQRLLSDPNLMQINWDNLYADNRTNKQTINNVNGSGKSYTGNLSEYVMGDKVNDLRKITLNTNFERVQNEHSTLYGGFTFVTQHNEIYKQLTDLMGGDYFVNYNQFASLQTYGGNQNYIQNNVNDPNAVVKVGDKYGYDYVYRFNSEILWLQKVYTYNKYNFFVAANLTNTQFSREGLMKNGLFANNSYGLSDLQSFFSYGFKAGGTYKIDRKNFLFLNAAYLTAPPTPDNTFVAPTIQNLVAGDPKVQRSTVIEGGYLMRSTTVNARVVGYINETSNASQIKRFYNDDPAYYTFVNYVMQNENTRSLGTELMLDMKLPAAFSVTGIAAIGQAFYTNRPSINVYVDNDTNQHPKPSQAYIKNYYLAVGPQTVYSLIFNYRPRNYWYANIDFTYTDRNYVDINPNKRTPEAVDLIASNSPTWNKILAQEKLPSAFLVNLHVSKSIQLSRHFKGLKHITGNNTLLNLSLGINNLLNNTSYYVRGSEQLRYDFANINPNKFQNQYQTGLGTTYTFNISLKF